jgi:hypothetical protein
MLKKIDVYVDGIFFEKASDKEGEYFRTKDYTMGQYVMGLWIDGKFIDPKDYPIEMTEQSHGSKPFVIWTADWIIFTLIDIEGTWEIFRIPRDPVPDLMEEWK